jgi:hypothetical protein
MKTMIFFSDFESVKKIHAKKYFCYYVLRFSAYNFFGEHFCFMFPTDLKSVLSSACFDSHTECLEFFCKY